MYNLQEKYLPIRFDKWGDRFIRILYLEYVDDNKTIVDLVDSLNHMDKREYEAKRYFEETQRGWQPQAA